MAAVCFVKERGTLGVFMNLGYQEKGKLLPKPVIYIHALIAVIGVILLIVAAIG